MKEMKVIDKDGINRILELADRGHNIFDDALLLQALRDMCTLYRTRIRSLDEFLEEIREGENNMGHLVLYWSAAQNYGGLESRFHVEYHIDTHLLGQMNDPDGFVAMQKEHLYDQYLDKIARGNP